MYCSTVRAQLFPAITIFSRTCACLGFLAAGFETTQLNWPWSLRCTPRNTTLRAFKSCAAKFARITLLCYVLRLAINIAFDVSMALAFETFVPLPRRQTMTFEKRRTAFVHERFNDTFKRCRLHDDDDDDYNTRGARTLLAIAYSPRGIYLISPSAAAYSLKNRVLFLPSFPVLCWCTAFRISG